MFFTIFNNSHCGPGTCSYYIWGRSTWHSKSPSADFLHSQYYFRTILFEIVQWRRRWWQIFSKQSGNSVKLLLIGCFLLFFVLLWKPFCSSSRLKLCCFLLCFIKIWFQHVLKLNNSSRMRYWKANEITYYAT